MAVSLSYYGYLSFTFYVRFPLFYPFSIRTEKMLIFSFYTVFKKYSCLKITCCGLSYASGGNEFALINHKWKTIISIACKIEKLITKN